MDHHDDPEVAQPAAEYMGMSRSFRSSDIGALVMADVNLTSVEKLLESPFFKSKFSPAGDGTFKASPTTIFEVLKTQKAAETIPGDQLKIKELMRSLQIAETGKNQYKNKYEEEKLKAHRAIGTLERKERAIDAAMSLMDKQEWKAIAAPAARG